MSSLHNPHGAIICGHLDGGLKYPPITLVKKINKASIFEPTARPDSDRGWTSLKPVGGSSIVYDCGEPDRQSFGLTADLERGPEQRSLAVGNRYHCRLLSPLLPPQFPEGYTPRNPVLPP